LLFGPELVMAGWLKCGQSNNDFNKVTLSPCTAHAVV